MNNGDHVIGLRSPGLVHIVRAAHTVNGWAMPPILHCGLVGASHCVSDAPTCVQCIVACVEGKRAIEAFKRGMEALRSINTADLGTRSKG